MLSFGQLIEEGHDIETRVLQQSEAQGRVLELLHISAILEVLGQAAPAGVLGDERNAQGAAGAVMVGVQEALPVSRVINRVVLLQEVQDQTLKVFCSKVASLAGRQQCGSFDIKGNRRGQLMAIQA